MTKTVVIVGAGPIGLAAAAHAVERGLRPLLFEAGSRPGDAIRRWQHIRMFSSWALNIDGAAKKLLEASGWQAPRAENYPSGKQFCEKYLEPLARTPELASRIRLNTRVTAITRIERDKLAEESRAARPFVIAFENGDGREGRVLADAVIDCSGNWQQPQPAGAGGIRALGESQAADKLHYGPVNVLGAARARFSGKRIGVLGNRHSAICTLIDVAQLAAEAPGTRPIWLVRSAKARNDPASYVPSQLAALEKMMQDIHELTATGRVELHTDFSLDSIDISNGSLILKPAKGHALSVDELIVATGFRPNFDFLRELRLNLDPKLECPLAIAPLIDPAVHTARTVHPHGVSELSHPDANVFIAGIKSYGRAATFLLIVGYEQVRSIVAHLAGDNDAANRVELALPWDARS